VTYRIEGRPRARKAFLALDKPVRRRIGEAVDALAADPRPAAAKMITGAHGVLRIRVGDYRVVYTIDEGELVVLVLDAGHRSEIYGRD
jgi:mRNA interferase RelE/StbE